MKPILKIDDERRRIFGIAMVGDEVDQQGDMIDDSELEDASFRAVTNGAIVKVEHDGPAVGRVVASWPLTKQIADSLGIERPNGQSVWLVGLEVTDPDAWAAVRSGELGHALSVGGRAERTPA